MSAPAPERSPAASSAPATHPAAPGPRRDDPYYRWSLVIAIAFMVFLAFPLLGAAQASLADPKWIGFYFEAYAFAGLIYVLLCGSVSFYGRRIERKLRRARSR